MMWLTENLIGSSDIGARLVIAEPGTGARQEQVKKQANKKVNTQLERRASSVRLSFRGQTAAPGGGTFLT